MLECLWRSLGGRSDGGPSNRNQKNKNKNKNRAIKKTVAMLTDFYTAAFHPTLLARLSLSSSSDSPLIQLLEAVISDAKRSPRLFRLLVFHIVKQWASRPTLVVELCDWNVQLAVDIGLYGDQKAGEFLRETMNAQADTGTSGFM